MVHALRPAEAGGQCGGGRGAPGGDSSWMLPAAEGAEAGAGAGAGAEAAEDAALLEAAGPSDVLVAVRAAAARLLPRAGAAPGSPGSAAAAAVRAGAGPRAEAVPAGARAVAPFALRSQIQALLPALGEVELEEELQGLRGARLLRLLRFPGAPSGSSACSTAVVLWDDYVAAAGRAKAAFLRRAGATPDRAAVFDRFCARVLPRCLGECVGEAELQGLLRGGGGGGGGGGGREGGASWPGGGEADVTALVRGGLLTPQIDRDGGEYFYFALPGVGPVARSVDRGRRGLLRALARRQRREMLERDALRLRLPGSFLDPRFHVQDALGAGFLTARDSTAGRVLRLAPGYYARPASKR